MNSIHPFHSSPAYPDHHYFTSTSSTMALQDESPDNLSVAIPAPHSFDREDSSTNEQSQDRLISPNQASAGEHDTSPLPSLRHFERPQRFDDRMAFLSRSSWRGYAMKQLERLRDEVQSIKDTIDPNKIRHIQDVGASFPLASRLIGMSKQAET